MILSWKAWKVTQKKAWNILSFFLISEGGGDAFCKYLLSRFITRTRPLLYLYINKCMKERIKVVKFYLTKTILEKKARIPSVMQLRESYEVHTQSFDAWNLLGRKSLNQFHKPCECLYDNNNNGCLQETNDFDLSDFDIDVHSLGR